MAISDYNRKNDAENFSWKSFYKQFEAELKRESTKKERQEKRAIFRNMLQFDTSFNSGMYRELIKCGFVTENKDNPKFKKFTEKYKNEIASIK